MIVFKHLLPITEPTGQKEFMRFDDIDGCDDDADGFLREVVTGLSRPQKEIPCKFLYDERGSTLFEQICETEDYYPTRTELGIMHTHIGEIASIIGPRAVVVEYGSGSSTKTRLLLDALDDPSVYVPIDISEELLLSSAESVRRGYAGLDVHPVRADYTRDFELPSLGYQTGRQIVYFPGSTIGNFEPVPAEAFLKRIAKMCGSTGALLIGVDLEKDVDLLEAAYNDSGGVTAAFNLNLLRRANRELGANFDLDHFRHEARFNPAHGRVEMHLVSGIAQTVTIGEISFAFERGESIWTESSYKRSLDGFSEVADGAGLQVEQVWTDPEGLFSLQYLVAHS